MNKRISVFLACLASTAWATSASALPILSGTDSGSGLWEACDSEGRCAEIQFVDTGDGFTATLTNTGEIASVQPNEVLVGVVFEFYQDPMLSDPSVTANSLDSNNPSMTFTYGDNVDGEYGFEVGTVWTPDWESLGTYILSASSYDPLGINPPIDETKSYDPDGLGGADFGIVNCEYGTTTCSVSNGVKHWVEDFITMDFLTEFDFALSTIKQVNFLYGTDFYSVPEPTTLSLLGAGLALIGVASRRRRKVAA